MKYQEKLNELKVDENILPTILKEAIEEISDASDALSHARKQILELEDDDEIDGFEQQINELESTIANLDDDIVTKIDKWYQKRVRFKENMEKGKNLVLQTKEEPKEVKTEEQKAQPQPQPQPQSQPKVEVVEQPKKKTNWALWLVAGLVAVITVNQVLIKTED